MHRILRPFRFLALAALPAAVAPCAHGQLLADELPPELEGVGIVERLDEQVPLDLAFTDEQGRTVRLADYFRPGRPVVLTLNYYRCPMLCSLTLNGMVDGLNGVEWSAGEEFEIVTVSINPEEGPELAEVKKRAYLTQYRRESAGQGWHFLTGEQASIEALAQAVGFGYRRLDDGEYAHTASIMFLTPDGRLSRYMNDVKFEPRDLRLALVEASQGAVGSAMDRFALFMCYQYDPEKGSYVPAAWKIMRAGGLLTLILIIAGIFVLSRLGSKAQHSTNDDRNVALGGLHS